MMHEQIFIEYGEHRIACTIERRPRKTVEIAVEPDTTVSVVAPLDASIEAVETRLRKRAAWILRQQRYFMQFMPRTPERLYVAGETHLYLGRQYRLKIIEHIQQRVVLTRGSLLVHSPCPKHSQVTQEIVDNWFRERARIKFAERVAVSVDRFATPEVFTPAALVVRHLAQRWGSMTPAGRLILNRRLVHAPIDAIDYVITHELCHIAEPHHGPAFFALLDRTLPDWRKRKDRLERVMA